MPDCTVIIAEDHGITSDGIKFLLDGVSGVNVLQVVQDGEAAVKAVNQHEPDVLILDIALPKRNGLMVLETIRDLKTRTLVLSGQASGLDFQRALEGWCSRIMLQGGPTGCLT
ncbi:MAG: response regulator transcription factor [Proteobacteria bacterium]|nr:response regulator transcription factor [Pseudomonadota bacterium]